jgi:hypothetical protein
MPHDVRLDCFTFQVRSRQTKNNRPEYYNLKELSFYDGQQRQILNFRTFFEKFMQSFDGKFAGLGESETVIYPPKSAISFASEKELIYGFVKGGKSGIAKTIVDKNKPDDEIFRVTADHVDSIDYFFMIWAPMESKMGVILIQGFSTNSISESFCSLIKKFFTDNIEDRLFQMGKFIPKDTIEQMKDKGDINKITLKRHKLNSDKANSILGLNFIHSEVVIEVKISGLKNYSKQFKDILTLDFENAFADHRFFSTPILEDIGMDGTHDVLIEYEFNGKKATAKKSQNYTLSPYYYVDESSIERDKETNLPTKDSLKEYCLAFFDKLLQEEILPKRNNE